MKNYLYLFLLMLPVIAWGPMALAQKANKTNKIEVKQFGVNNNSERTSNRLVTLNFAVENGVPTSYSVAENPEMVGKVWLPYMGAPTFLLSKGVGLKDIYFAIATTTDTSAVVSNKIYLDESVTLKSNGLAAKLFPNPVEDNLNIEFEETIPVLNVTVYSMSGQVFVSKSFNNTKIVNLDVSSCPKGALLVRLSSGNKYAIQRIIKL